MEAIGQLTGGIAHDFNNMLAIMLGSIDLIKKRLSRGDNNILPLLDSASDGAERAAKLTRSLLAFSRQQALSPEPLQINKLLTQIAEFLSRSLGEQVHLETVTAGGLWNAFADSNQLENAILNLALNARDAMPNGGKLTIEVSNAALDDEYAARHNGVSAGQHVVVAVTDTGSGMSQDVIEKAFDPFFTTKPVGQGTGLGLSQVFGFVRQSGGHIKIYSEIGIGTTVKIYLPRYYGPSEEASAAPRSVESPKGTSAEVIIVVEDEDQLRKIVANTLRDLGYTVLEAEGGAAALREIHKHPELVLLFTDIVMPEMNGRELADEALKLNSNLKILYTTGYSKNAVVHNGILDAGIKMISKPYAFDELAKKIRAVLDETNK